MLCRVVREVHSLRDSGRLDPARYVELAEQVADVHAGGLFADEQGSADFAVGAAGGE
jgi:hypothetical protein